MDSNSDAGDAGASLQQFLSIVSHDLNGPLRQIISFGEILEEEESQQLSPEGRRYVQSIVSAGSRMQQMLDGLLQLSRVASRGQPFHDCDLNTIVNASIDDLGAEIRDSGASIHFESLPAVHGDDRQLRNLLTQLLHNGLQFARPGVAPEISIDAHPHHHPGRVLIRVCDNGCGFEPKYADDVFEVFLRLDPQAPHRSSGTGLTLCREICARHGGQIRANAQPDNGTCIEFDLARQRANQSTHRDSRGDNQ